ncbi:MAG: GNAT family N-acetyltransferase [Bacteroidales bacterium]|nr:GNAT family N-acetyltransferase [Bacteroidales bacterium]
MIETERTNLRAIERTDLPLRTQWLNNPMVRETLILSVPISEAQVEHWFKKILKDPSREDFIIVYKEDKAPIGFAGYIGIDWIHRKAEPYIAIGSTEHWGIGLGTEVVRKLLDYGFNEMGFNRQYGFMLDNNPGALKMDLKAGFKEEGLLKQDVMIHGEYHDRIMLGITKDEFNKNKLKSQ